MPAIHAFLAALLGLPLAATAADAPGPDAPPVEPGLILNPGFEPERPGGPPARWILAQHAGPRSFEATAEDGELVLRRIDDSPWGMVSQKLDASALAGKRLSFSMELSGALEDPDGTAQPPPGLFVRVMGRSPRDPPMLGRRHLLTMRDEPGLAAGTHAWKRHELQFEVPEALNLELTIGVQMSMGGELRARAPSLVVIEGDD